MAENEDDPRERFYIVQFSNGHTSPSLDTMAQVLGYIDHFYPMWEKSDNKKTKQIIIEPKYRLIGPTPGQIKREREHMAYKSRVSAKNRKIAEIERRLTGGKAVSDS